MSEFVKQKFGLPDFNDAHAFYEFTSEENLLYCKDVIYMYKGQKEGSSDTVHATLLSCSLCFRHRKVKKSQSIVVNNLYIHDHY